LREQRLVWRSHCNLPDPIPRFKSLDLPSIRHYWLSHPAFSPPSYRRIVSSSLLLEAKLLGVRDFLLLRSCDRSVSAELHLLVPPPRSWFLCRPGSPFNRMHFCEELFLKCDGSENRSSCKSACQTQRRRVSGPNQ